MRTVKDHTHRVVHTVPFIANEGIRIHYRVEGKGSTLVLQHGFMDSMETWYELGYVDGLKPYHRVVLIDARGHGASDKPYDPEDYDLKNSVNDIVGVLDRLDIPKANFFGYSMGAFIGFGVAKYAPERFTSLVLGGSNPYPHPVKSIDLRIKKLKEGPEGILSLWGPVVSSGMRDRLVRNDTQALCAYLVQRGREPSLEEILPTIAMPCLVFVGETDWSYQRTKACIARIPKATFVSFPGLNHVEVLYSTEMILQLVTRFLRTVDKKFPPASPVNGP
jgi:pimeloyl-ACP methyl ester carboxylesterase